MQSQSELSSIRFFYSTIIMELQILNAIIKPYLYNNMKKYRYHPNSSLVSFWQIGLKYKLKVWGCIKPL